MKKSLGPKTIVYPTPVFVVCTYNSNGQANAMTASWGGICCSNPPCIAVSIRKVTHSYQNVIDRKAFTVNIPSESLLREADYFGMVSGKNVDKFAATKLTPLKADHVDAPFIKEFPFVLECRLLHIIEVGLHTQFIGEVLDLKAEESCCNDEGLLDIERVKPFLFTPESRKYYAVGRYLAKAFSAGRDIGSQTS